MDLKYFEQRLRDSERALQDFETSGFRLIEFTSQGERDVTEEHKEYLQRALVEYQRVVTWLKTKP
jgi:hypothetical protein